MYTCTNLKKIYLNDFKVLYNINNNFDNKNNEFFELYNYSNFIKRLILRKNVRLLIKDTECVGYIWFQPKNNRVYTVISMYIKSEIKIIELYQRLMKSVGSKNILYYNCNKNFCDFNILENIGFTKVDGVLLMEIETRENNLTLEDVRNTHFEKFVKGKDERLRCELQNEIFNNMQRVPLTPQDINMDEQQDYYFDRGAIFIKRDRRYIGYGQIIIEHDQAFIVNLGILEKYRSQGYGRLLLDFLTVSAKESGYKKVKIKVNPDNIVAIKMYKNAGFKIIDESYNWILKK